MKSFKFSARVIALVSVALMAVILGAPAVAKDNPKDHPLRVLKAKVDSRGRSFAGSKGSITIWLQNAAPVTVDGIAISVELYNGRRKINTISEDVEPMESGAKRVVTLEWDEFEEVEPRFFVEYNSRGTQKTKFEGESPVWN